MCSGFSYEQHESLQAVTLVVPMTRKEVSLAINEGVMARETIYHGIIEHNELIVRGGEVLFFGWFDT